MTLSRERLLLEAASTGFRPENLEKEFQLIDLLQSMFQIQYLKDRLALKGGTALNLFCFDVPRLSIDIDLNCIGAVEREAMMAERPKVENALKAVCEREGYRILRIPSEHAGGKWHLRYESVISPEGSLQLDLNFMYRIPLWPVVPADSAILGSYNVQGIPILDIHELTAGKLSALLSRASGRDLFDAQLLLTQVDLNPEKLRLAFVIYGAMNRKDWRTVSVEQLDFNPRDLVNDLLPMLRQDFTGEKGDAITWAECLIRETHEALGIVLPLNDTEMEFLDRLLEDGEIVPEILTGDKVLTQKILNQPLLKWKAQNVREHKRK